MSTTAPTRPEDLELVVGDEEAADEVREADLRNGEPGATATPPHSTPPPGTSAHGTSAGRTTLERQDGDAGRGR
jgi:hypothetical protein